MSLRLISDNNNRQLPQDIPAEQAVLGSILMNDQAMARVQPLVKAEQFFEPVHGRIFEAMLKLWSDGQPVSPVTLAHAMGEDPDLGDVGKGHYFSRLLNSVVEIRDCEHHARRVADLAMRRALIELHTEAMARAYAPTVEFAAEGLVADARGAIDRIMDGAAIAYDMTLQPALEELVTEIERRSAGEPIPGLIPTSLVALDERIGGLRGGNVYVFAGRPGMGKTGFASHLMMRAAAFFQAVGDRRQVLDFSFEMSKKQMKARFIAEITGIPFERLLGNGDALTKAERESVARAGLSIAQMPILIADRGAGTVDDLRATALGLHARRPVGLVVIDHLNLMKASREQRRMGSRVQEIAEITGGLKALAKELRCPVVELVQLNRGVEGREEKRPNMGDLRDGGTIEQDADVIGFLYREEYYLRRQSPADDAGKAALSKKILQVSGLVEILLDKVRDGRPGRASVKVDLGTNRWRDFGAKYGDGPAGEEPPPYDDSEIR